jgi:hypothetical protein
MVSELAKKVYFRYWGLAIGKDVSDVKLASITCLELMRDSCMLSKIYEINEAIEEIRELYRPKK